PGLLQTRLLTFLDPSITGHQTCLLECGSARFGIDGVESARNAKSQSSGLTGYAAAVNSGHDVVKAAHRSRSEGLRNQLLMQLVGEVVVEGATIDRPLPAAGDEADPGHRLLATTGCR